MQGDIIGTPAYMAPEQAEGRLEQIDERTDVYGLGAMFYEILTGKPPFVGVSTLEVLKKAIRGNPAPPRESWPEVPPALEEICLKAMARDPAARYARADELAQAVQQWQEVQRRRAEDALRRQTEVLRSILNSMSEGVLVSDETGNVLLINPAAERMIGRSERSTPAGAPGASEFYKPDQVTRFDPRDLPLARAIHGEEVNDVEMFIRPAAGTEGFWASANARPLRDEAGALRGGLVVFRDITERKRAEAELVRSRERFELAVRGSQDGLWDWDPQTGEIYYSPRWKSIIGYEEHEIAPRIEEWEERLHPEDRERVLAENRAHLEGATPYYECEYRLRHKDGTYRWILARGVALRDAAGVAYRAAGSHVDITERKQAEEERARLLLRLQEAQANTGDPG
jgi:PAS domain S-box-containing protein